MCLPNFMKFCHCFFKILKNQNVADGWMPGRTNNVKTVYSPTNTVCGGYNYRENVNEPSNDYGTFRPP